MGLNTQKAASTLLRSALIGAVGFSVASLVVFSTVAFGERWMYRTLGLYGAYAVWTVLFILLGGLVLGPLSTTRWRLPKFYILFALAFFAYAAGWVTAYFTLRGLAGQWVGAIAGSVLMASVFAIGYSRTTLVPKLSVLLLITNAIGYFLGSMFYYAFGRPLGMMLWGVVYGLGFGAGIGASLFMLQQDNSELRSR